MVNALKTFALAAATTAALALAPMTANASVVLMSDGGTYTLGTSDIYKYVDTSLAVGSGPGSLNFYFTSAGAPGAVAGTVYLTAGAGLDHGTAAWFMGSTELMSQSIGPASTFMATAFQPGDTYTLKLSWDDVTSDGILSAKVSPVPVPAAGVLLLGGLGAMGALRRRKKATA